MAETKNQKNMKKSENKFSLDQGKFGTEITKVELESVMGGGPPVGYHTANWIHNADGSWTQGHDFIDFYN